MPSSSYAKQKLWQAVHALATRDGSLQGRLADAVVYLVDLRSMDSAIAPEYREKLTAILDSLTSEPPAGGEGAISATTRKMTIEEARRIADSIWDLFSKLCVDLS
jgi:hypothetical protein